MKVRPSRALARARASVELFLQRVTLPRRYEREALDALLQRVSRRSALGSPSLEPELLARDLRRIEAVLARTRLLPSTCLYVALGRYAVLSRLGYGAAFLMGLPRVDAGGEGHAWVEVDGEPFAENEDVARYVVTFRYPPSAGGDTLPQR